MDIYIQSCGIAFDQDYHWRKIEGEGWEKQKEKAPHNFFTYQVKNSSRKVNDYFEQGETSLLFLGDQDNDQFILLIRALKARDRSKIYGRGVRNFVVIIDTNKDLVKGIFDYVKHNWESFREKIDKHIEFDATNGFIVKKFSEFEGYLKGLQKENDYERTKKSDEIKNVQELEILLSKEEKTTKKSNNSLIIVGVLLIVLVIIIVITLVKKDNQEKPPQSQIQKEDTCQTMMKNWHPPCLYLTNYPTIKEMEKQQIRQ